MRILHYFLGFPPYRTGGLTKYCFDLMSEQRHRGDEVFALWPGRMGFIRKKTSIRKRKDVQGIHSYELIEPLPVPLDEGIADVDAYTATGDRRVYERFLDRIQPEVIHIHTLMGLHREFIFAASDRGIRTVFTSHDYFGLCPKVTFYRNGTICSDGRDCTSCAACNQTALSVSKVRILQSPVYRMLKNSFVVKWLRKRHRNSFHSTQQDEIVMVKDAQTEGLAENYLQLRAYYLSMLERMDLIHFNSTVSEEIYRQYCKPKDSTVLTISHRDIGDFRRETRRTSSPKLRMLCLAPAKPYKGFTVIKKALDELWASGYRQFELTFFSAVQDVSPYMVVRENGFARQELQEIFANADILLAPSVWYETFGFTVLEALSFGVPVIVSDRVGAKDIVAEGGLVIEAGSVEALKDAVVSLTPEKIADLREKVRDTVRIKDWNTFVKENDALYRGEQAKSREGIEPL